MAQGLVAGERQAVDSAPVKANASLDSLRKKQPLEALASAMTVAGQPASAPTAPHPAALLSAPAHQLRREAVRQAKRLPKPAAAPLSK